jgi:hypothetical protein
MPCYIRADSSAAPTALGHAQVRNRHPRPYHPTRVPSPSGTWPIIAAMSTRLCGVLAMLACASHASAEQVIPSDAELHSMYCATVVNAEIYWLQEEAARMDAAAKAAPSQVVHDYAARQHEQVVKLLGEAKTAQSRLQAYLQPRSAMLDTPSMLEAIARGKADWQSFEAMSQRCDKCIPMPGAERQKCVDSCGDVDLASRIDACSKPTWL